MNDTSPVIARLVHSRLMAKIGEERFLMGFQMHEAARRMVMASFPAEITKHLLRGTVLWAGINRHPGL